MKGTEEKLEEFLEGSRKRFVIPVYQRNYDWNLENCKQLYDDLITLIHTGAKSHFFGCFVSQVNPDGNSNEVLIIDGQQRLTTVSLLLLALCNCIRDGKVEAKEEGLDETIFETYLTLKRDKSNTKLKLKPIKSDEAAFNGLFTPSEEKHEDSNMTINYQYFYNRISDGDISADQLLMAIENLQIINIGLGSDDNAQRIFESLNSKGMALSQGDLIRNYILMNQSIEDQERLYEKYWKPMEGFCAGDITAFFRIYLTVKIRQVPSVDKIYPVFKKYCSEEAQSKETLLQDMLDYSKRYNILVRGYPKDKTIDGSIQRLNRLETTVVRPFLIEVIRRQESGELTIEDIAQIFSITEHYIFRRAVCDLPTNRLKGIFMNLDREIVRLDGTTADYLDKYRYTLLTKTDNSRYPDQGEFIEKFRTRDVYKMNSRLKSYIFERLENQGTKEDKDVYRHLDDGTYSIEHIMPQHLTDVWMEDLGEDYETIHDEWLHRIANLTLTAYNSQMSNGSFQDKKEGENGFKDSGIRMNQWVCQQERWTLSELEERDELLSERASRIWPMITTSYVPSEDSTESFSLDQEVDVTHSKPSKIEYMGKEYQVRSWVELYLMVLRLLDDDNPSILAKLASDSDSHAGLSNQVIRSDGPVDRFDLLKGDIYVCTNNSAESKIELLRKFFTQFDEDPAELTIHLQQGSGNGKNGSESERVSNDRRRRYWTYSLDRIKERMEGKLFSNTEPNNNHNYVSNSVGVRGVYMACVFAKNSVRVEVLIDKKSADDAHLIFDELYSHKDEIESELGVGLNWIRDVGKTSSKIYHQDDSLNIMDESYWDRIAEFHATWARKMYDVILPYLRS